MRTKWQHVVELKGRRGCRIKENTLINIIRYSQKANASMNKGRILARRTSYIKFNQINSMDKVLGLEIFSISDTYKV